MRVVVWALIAMAGVSCGEPPSEVGFLSNDDAKCSGPIGWHQPPSSHLGYEGYCGQTSIANALLFEGVEMTPKQVLKKCSDKTPGTRPDTMFKCVNKLSEFEWFICDEECLDVDTDEDWEAGKLRNTLAERLRLIIDAHGPVVALTHERTLAYHWQVVTASTEKEVTTMEKRRDKAVHRESVSWDEFENRWARGDGLLGSYIFLVRKEKPAIWTGNEDSCDLIGNRYFTGAVRALEND